MNESILSGYLANNPDVRYTQSGKAVASFTLAVNKRIKNPRENQKTADFIQIVAWENLAEICGAHLIKGSRVLVKGSISTRTYDAQDGSKRYVTEVVITSVEFLSSKGMTGTGGIDASSIPDEDIPF
jgi:single-strand DNA-binding protein